MRMRHIFLLKTTLIALFLSACNIAAQQTDLLPLTPTRDALECSEGDEPLIEEQVEFEGLLAGKTTMDEVIALLGEPEDTLLSERRGLLWFYETGAPRGFGINFKDDVIFEIWWEENYELAEIIATYGCPDILTHTEDLHIIYLVYLDAGVYFKFFGEYLTSRHGIDEMYYFQPMGKEEFYLRTPSLYLENPLGWEELYRQCRDPLLGCEGEL